MTRESWDIHTQKPKNDNEQIPNLHKLGASKRKAGIMANTKKGYRRSKDSHIVKLAISKELLRKAGYTFLQGVSLETAVYGMVV